MWEQASSAMNDFLIMRENVRISKGKASIPFLGFSPTCSSASIHHNRQDHSLLGGSFLNYPSTVGVIHIRIPEFNHIEEE